MKGESVRFYFGTLAYGWKMWGITGYANGRIWFFGFSIAPEAQEKDLVRELGKTLARANEIHGMMTVVEKNKKPLASP